MKFDLMISDNDSIIIETSMGLTTCVEETNKEVIWQRVKDLEDKEDSFMRHNGTNGCTICNSKISLFWNNKNKFETLSMDLKSFNKKDKEHNSIIIIHTNDKYGFKPSQIEILNLYSFMEQLLFMGYNKNDTIYLEDLRTQWTGLYAHINSNNIAIITRDCSECEFNQYNDEVY